MGWGRIGSRGVKGIGRGAGAGGSPPPAPAYLVWSRVFGTMIGEKNYQDLSIKQQIAPTGMTLIGMYRGQFTTTQMNQHLDDIYGLHNASYAHPLLIAQYTNIVEVSASLASSNASADVYQKCLDNNWMLKTAAGAEVESNIQAPKHDINILNAYVSTDGSGKRMPQWMAQRDYDLFFGPAGASRLPVWSFDNSNRRPRSDAANWHLDGVNLTNTDATLMVEFRTAQAAWWAAAQALAPGVELYGNPDLHQTNVEASALSHTEYSGKLDGGFAESYINFDNANSVDSAGGFTRVMNRYESYRTHLKGPKRFTLNARGPITDYKRMRYGLCIALLHPEGYFSYTSSSAIYMTVPAFDEYDLPIGDVVDGSYGTQGNFRYRVYDELMAVVHVTTGTDTFDAASIPGGPWRTFDGAQDPTTNNNAVFTSRSFTGKDGIILVR